jgi:outer membrane protein OmpA-like peptidoglycan-associated protein
VENIRTVLAAIAALVGIILILSALFRLRVRRDAEGTRREQSLGWLFGFLFLAVAGILWYRGSPELSSSLFPDKPVAAKEESIPKTPETKQPQNTDSGAGSSTSTIVQDEVAADEQKLQSDAESSSKAQDFAYENDAQTEERKTSFSSSPDVHPLIPTELPRPQAKNFGKAASSVKSEPRVDVNEVIYNKVDRLFTLIEAFFDKYGEPSPLHKSKEAPQPDAIARFKQIEFPEIQFASGTADLTYDSQMALCTLATKLTYDHTSGILEIQARVDSVGPEAFNFVLTQARAEAVRDYLISEGVPAERLVAVGRGTEGQNDTIADSGIEFVVR